MLDGLLVLVDLTLPLPNSPTGTVVLGSSIYVTGTVDTTLTSPAMAGTVDPLTVIYVVQDVAAKLGEGVGEGVTVCVIVT